MADALRGSIFCTMWRGEEAPIEYADVPGLCKSATLEEVRRHGHVLILGRYIGAEPQQDDGEAFEDEMARLTAQGVSGRPRRSDSTKR